MCYMHRAINLVGRIVYSTKTQKDCGRTDEDNEGKNPIDVAHILTSSLLTGNDLLLPLTEKSIVLLCNSRSFLEPLFRANKSEARSPNAIADETDIQSINSNYVGVLPCNS